MPRRTLEVLSQKLVAGITPGDAVDQTVLEISNDLALELRHKSLPDALSSVGIDESLADQIQREAQGEDRHHIVDAFQIVIGGGGGGAGGVPTAECLKRHLPAGRKPTKDEVDAAVKACRKPAFAVRV